MPDSQHIFVSFASADVALAHRAVEALERSGLRCWISDRDIAMTASYPAAITSAVKECGVLLLLLTESSNTSRHVLREVEMAFNARRPILPVRIAGVTPSSDLQYFLSTTQWLDAGAAFDDQDLAKVQPALKDLLERGPGLGTWGTGERRRWAWIAAGVLGIMAVAILVVWSSRGDRSGTEGVPANDRRPPAPSPDTPPPAQPTVKTNPRDGQTYVWVAPGQFLMGCSEGDPDCQDDEKPVHMVEIARGFWLSRTEVTDAQFRNTSPGGRAGEAGEGDLPATAVSWAAAKAYCAAVGGRLPTEAEWEFAARAGTPTRYYGSLPAVAWFGDNSEEHVHPVGMKTPNALGLHDMLGNVAEWVLDRYYNKYDDTSGVTDVEEPLAGNASGVARGGSWVSEPTAVRVSRRLAMPPDAEEPFIGFRCAVDQL